MAAKTVNFKAHCELSTTFLDTIAKWLSCNGEIWGVGPTLVFASAAALFLYNELRSTVFIASDQPHVYMLEKTLISTMIVGMLALMIHIWVCTMRFFQYYLDTIIKDSPSLLLEMTTAGLLGGKAEMVALGPLTRFLRQQQPQIHITVCWFLSLCYADYIRKNYCTSFNMPYLEQWQTEMQDRVTRSVNRTMQRVNSFVGSVHQRMRGYVTPDQEPECDPQAALIENRTTERSPFETSSMEIITTRSGIMCNNGCPSSVSCTSAKELGVRLVGTASDTTAQAIEKLRQYVQLFQWVKCGDSAISVVPTLLWAAGAAALANRLLSALFRRFLFRRVPLWELILQHLLFIWMVIYSLHFWVLVVRLISVAVEFCFRENETSTKDDIDGSKMMQQWMIWMCAVAPLAIYIQTRPRPEVSPLMIWITTNPWQRREMGPYGYYLNRPLSHSLQSSTNVSIRQQALTLRRAFSDSKIIIKEPPKKRRHSKSV